MEQAQIGVFGGSGFYKFGENVKEVTVNTPYGCPSSKLFIAEVLGKKVAFLPRHGMDHALPPHKINYRANLWAMKEVGVKQVLGPCASGSLQKHVKPGDIVFCDQFVDRTNARPDTFYDGPIVAHIGCAHPYCDRLRMLASKAANELNLVHKTTGTVVVIQGPRFASKAESLWYKNQGWEVINMTQYPEVVLAKELEMCYLNISLITDYDNGLEGEVPPTNAKEIMEVFNNNLHNLKNLLFKLIETMPENCACGCHHSLASAIF